MRHGIRLALERGDGRRAAMGLNNLAVELMTAAGPREAVHAFEEGIEIAEQRGIRASELWTRASSLQSRFDLGLWDQVQADSGRLRAIPSWGVDSAIRTQVLAIEIRILNGRGDRERTRSLADDARELAQAMRETPTTVDVFSALAEAWLGAGDRERAIDALRQITADPLAPASWNLPLFLPEIVRTAVRVDPTIAREITAYIDPRSPVRARALPPAHAIIAEAEGDLERATDLYARAAEDFAAGGWMYEEAIALLGRGRCLVALGRDGTEPLGRARAFFAGVGAVPYLAETDGLLDGGVALSS
jgi:tetratricopeptide (TPR) repeat protein